MTAKENGILGDQRVAFTGKALSFSREQARQIVESRGGIFQLAINEHSSLLVIGAAGWPLQNNGRITRNLELAERMRRDGHPIRIENEEGFLDLIGSDSSNLRRNYSLPQLSRLLQLSPQQLHAWLRLGLLKPSGMAAGIGYFDFQQVVRCRLLAKLAGSRIGIRRLRRAAKMLKQHRLDHSMLDRLVMLDSDVAVRQDDGSLSSMSGQLLFDFFAGETASLVLVETGLDTDFEAAVELEGSGRFEDAERIYRQILERQPDDCDVLFNLGNVLVELHQMEEAIEVYQGSVYWDPEFKEAWNNLGNSLREMRRMSDALLAYQQALLIDSDYPAAHYGIACTLEQFGRLPEAITHWKTYLELEQEGECARYARQRLHDDYYSSL